MGKYVALHWSAQSLCNIDAWKYLKAQASPDPEDLLRVWNEMSKVEKRRNHAVDICLSMKLA